MKKKKTIRKIKSATKDIAKKTKSFMKKANGIVGTLKKQWEKEQPQREKFKIAANKALGNGIKISGDVFATVRKDINEIKRQNKAKK